MVATDTAPLFQPSPVLRVARRCGECVTLKTQVNDLSDDVKRRDTELTSLRLDCAAARSDISLLMEQRQRHLEADLHRTLEMSTSRWRHVVAV